MPTPTNLLPSNPPPAPGSAAPEYFAPPAVVARWERILNGRIEPGDYLTLPPDAMKRVEWEKGFAEARVGGALDPDYWQEILHDRALGYHYGGKLITALYRPEGVIVLAVGVDEVAEFFGTVPEHRRTGVATQTPRRW